MRSPKTKKAQWDRLKRVLDNATGEQEILRWLKSDSENALVLARAFSDSSVGNKIIAEFSFGTDFKADFVLFAPFSGGFDIHFIEIEPPNVPLYTKKGVHAERLATAIKQIQDWKIFVDANRDAVIHELDKAAKRKKFVFGEPGEQIVDNTGWPLYHPKAFLTWRYHIVIGRRRSLSDEGLQRKASSEDTLNVQIATFDRLLDNALR
jgi:hypothetical protein